MLKVSPEVGQHLSRPAWHDAGELMTKCNKIIFQIQIIFIIYGGTIPGVIPEPATDVIKDVVPVDPPTEPPLLF